MGGDRFEPNCKNLYTPTELFAQIKFYPNYWDIAKHEILVEYVGFCS